MSSIEVDGSARAGKSIAAKIDKIGWGLFLLWVGVALLVDVGWPVFFVGTGLILLGGQAARRRFGLTLDGFGLMLGVCLVAAGGLRALDVQLSRIVAPAWLVPAAFIAAGVAVVVSAWRKREP